MLTGADKHKTRDWMLLMQASLQEELCRQFLMHQETLSTPEDCTVEKLKEWLAEAASKDKTLKLVMYVVKLMQHRELFHSVRRPPLCLLWHCVSNLRFALHARFSVFFLQLF